MSFLQPTFLYGLLAVLIPVIIHLFDFRRTRKVYYSDTRLLRQVRETTRSTRQLKHWLILLSRILFIVFLVLTFARPYLPPVNSDRLQSSRVGIFIDNSQSMSNKLAGDATGLETAKSLADKLLNLYPAGTEFVVQGAYEEKGTLMYLSRQEAGQAIRDLSYVSQAQPLATILQKFNNTFNNQPPAEVILLSDFQTSTLFTRPLPHDSLRKYLLAPVRFTTYRNLVVDTAYIKNPFEPDLSKQLMEVIIRNTGRNASQDIAVRVFAGERQLAVANISLAAGTSAPLRFNIGRDRQATIAGRVVLEDYPVAFDNTFYFTLSPASAVRIAEVRGRQPSPYIAAVYGNRQLYQLSTMPATNIDYRALAEADLVVLNQLEAPDAGLLSRLLELRNNGTNILVIPAAKQDIDAWRTLLPIQMTNLNEPPAPLAPPDFSRPFFSGVVEKKEKMIAMPEARPVWQWGHDRSALLHFKDGRPFLSETRPGLYVLASPLLDSLTRFPVNALFVPVMYRLATRSRHSLTPLYYRLNDEEITLPVKGLTPTDIVKLSNGRITLVPDQHVTNRRLTLRLPGSNMAAGHYQVLADDRPLATLALNAPLAESQLAVADGEQLHERFKGMNYQIVTGDNEEQIIKGVTAAYKGIELWRYFLALALLFLLAEALLIRFL